MVLTDTMIALEEAHRVGDQQRIGWAHLDVVAALGEVVADAAGAQDVRAERRKMLDHADAALRAFADLESALQADAHLVKAAVLADIACETEDRGERLRWIAQSLEQCQLALTLLYQADDFHYVLVGDACVTAITVMLQLRRGLEDAEPVVEALEGMVAAYSELWGTFLAWDLRAREEGGTLLLQAQLLDALQGAGEPDEGSLEAARSQLELAWGAWEQLRHTGDMVRAQEARSLVDVAQQRVAVLEDARSQQKLGMRCPRCDFENASGVRFCTQCGSALAAGRVQEARWECPGCRRSNRFVDRFCTQCGTPRR